MSIEDWWKLRFPMSPGPTDRDRALWQAAQEQVLDRFTRVRPSEEAVSSAAVRSWSMPQETNVPEIDGIAVY